MKMELFIEVEIEPKNFAKGKDLLHKLGNDNKTCFPTRKQEIIKNVNMLYRLFPLFMVWSY